MSFAPIVKKLCLKPEYNTTIINTPENLREGFREAGLCEESPAEKVDFTLLFVKDKAELEKFFKAAIENATYDSLFWLAYPKGTSKNYKADINRDSIWKMLLPEGYRPVTQVAIDEDWSALRFRPVEEVKGK